MNRLLLRMELLTNLDIKGVILDSKGRAFCYVSGSLLDLYCLCLSVSRALIDKTYS